jgi:peptidoglycan/LPS O-acetylase OafA/YrhL
MKNSRNETVDFLRGIAILAVLIRHFQIAYQLNEGFFAQFVPGFILGPLVRNGNYGVTIFFVISGFLITSTSLKRFGTLGQVRPPQFYSFRFARIAPNITLMVGLVVLFSLCGIKIFANEPGRASMTVTVLSIATFTHNVLMQKFGYFNYCLNVLWSLSVEEVFYLTFPLLCIFAKQERIITLTFLALIVIAPFYRAQHANDATDIVVLYGYLSCFDAIAVGCLVAMYKKKYELGARQRQIAMTVASTLLVGVYFYKEGVLKNVVFGISLIAFSTGAILFVMKNENTYPLMKLKIAKCIQWFGSKSYELYLFHVIVLAFMRTAVKRDQLGFYSKPLWFLVFLVTSSLVAELVSRFYAEPLNTYLKAPAAKIFSLLMVKKKRLAEIAPSEGYG